MVYKKCIFWLFLCLALFFLIPAIGQAQETDLIKIIEALEKVLPDEKKKDEKKIYDEWGETLKKTLKFLKEREQERRGLNLEVSFGFHGNKAGDNNLYKLNVGAGFNKGLYPYALRFKAETTTQYKDNELTENVTKTLVNYDYNIRPFLTTYGFIERFSNTYLNLKQRYEIGIGLMMENEWGVIGKFSPEVKKWKSNDNLAQEKKKEAKETEIDKLFDKFKNHIKKLKKESSEENELLEYVKTLRKNAVKDVIQFVEKNYAQFTAGLATSLFLELEQIELEVPKSDTDGTGETKINKDEKTSIYLNEQPLRWTIRPSVYLRPTNFLTLSGMVYLKIRLDKPIRDDKFDYRTDTYLNATIEMGKIASWAKSTSMNIQYRQYYDNLPPEMDNSMLEENSALQEKLDKWPKRHHEIIFNLKIKF